MPKKKIVDGILYSVAAVIFNDKNEVLMFDRKGKEWETGWEPIKGGMHVGETEEEAVLREIKEEAGPIKVEMVGKLPDYVWRERPWRNGKLKIKGRIFIFKYISGDIRLGEEEHVGYRWMQVKKAKEKIWLKEGDKMIEESYRLFSSKM